MQHQKVFGQFPTLLLWAPETSLVEGYLCILFDALSARSQRP